MDLSVILQLFTNMDAFLVNLASNYGMMIYLVMFLIFYLETGVFVFSFLPGDSLLFVAGTVAAAGTTSPFGLMLAVIIGAIVGNTQAYSFGRWFGQKIYTKNFLFLKQDKLMRAKVFYDKHGGKTVFLGRFVPIIRAFVPIIAGAASMKSLRFEFYSMTGAVAWAVGLIGAGYLFGNIPIVRNNLTVILLIGVASAFSGPIIIAWILRMLHAKDARRGVPVTLPKD